MSGPLVGSGLSLEPPVFRQEKLEYRSAMERWVKTIATLTKAGNSQAACLSAVMAEVVMSSLPAELSAMVNSSVAQGDINLDAATFRGQLKAVQSIVRLIASDSPTEHVDRIANAYAAVSECKRKKNETVKVYATRFYSKAQTYLRIAGGDESDAGGLVLALVFVENALLTAETRQHVRLQLQQAAMMSVSGGNYVQSAGALSHGSDDDDEDGEADGDEIRQDATQSQNRRYAVPDGLFDAKGKAAVFTLADVYRTFQCLGIDDIAVRNGSSGGVANDSASHLQSQVDKLTSLNKVLMTRLQPGGTDQSKKIRCYGCGKLGHRRSDCPDGDKCNYCKKRGHVEATCFEKHGMLDKSPEERNDFLRRVRGAKSEDTMTASGDQQREGAPSNIPRAKNTPGEIFRRRRNSN